MTPLYHIQGGKKERANMIAEYIIDTFFILILLIGSIVALSFVYVRKRRAR
ncbi:EYxxD motif small membrane protein [Anoxybacillus kestanbolensis]|uniref:EYxxD motif small membrane protein n=1 Tax=Anoxybacillus kestanbolensis TaxID=227476 RepID=UPI003D1A3DEB